MSLIITVLDLKSIHCMQISTKVVITVYSSDQLTACRSCYIQFFVYFYVLDDRRVFYSYFVFYYACVCADGFRKVMHIDTGIIKQERDGPVEFQHPYFKQGQDELLENIKRKVESSLLPLLHLFFVPVTALTVNTQLDTVWHEHK